MDGCVFMVGTTSTIHVIAGAINVVRKQLQGRLDVLDVLYRVMDWPGLMFSLQSWRGNGSRSSISRSRSIRANGTTNTAVGCIMHLVNEARGFQRNLTRNMAAEAAKEKTKYRNDFSGRAYVYNGGRRPLSCLSWYYAYWTKPFISQLFIYWIHLDRSSHSLLLQSLF